jgi:hypothetical protein
MQRRVMTLRGSLLLAGSGGEAGQRGASAVEFAILAPVFFMLVFGTLSGGLAYNRKNSITHAAREGVRQGATKPIGKTGTAPPSSWFDDIKDSVVGSANGDLEPVVLGWYVCVAYVGNRPLQGDTVNDWTYRRVYQGSTVTDTDGSVTDATTWCFDDGRGSNGEERRVQVVAKRDSEINAVLWRMTVTLEAQAVARYEAVYPT